MFLLVLTLCNVKHQEFGIPHNRFVLVRPQDFIVAIILMLLTVIISEKLYDSSVDLFCSSFCFTAVQCPPLQELENGVASCRGDADMRFSYGNTCSFSCAPGYHLLGPSMVTCTSAAEWNERTPRCEGKSIPTVFDVVKKSFFSCAFVTNNF